jgi:hypothetical protein
MSDSKKKILEKISKINQNIAGWHETIDNSSYGRAIDYRQLRNR